MLGQKAPAAMSKPRTKTTKKKPASTPQQSQLPWVVQLFETIFRYPRVALLTYGFLIVFGWLVLVRPIAASLHGLYQPGMEVHGALIAIGGYIAVGLVFAALEQAGRGRSAD